MATFQIKKANDGQYFFNLVNNAGDEVLLRSELYGQKASCHTGINSVKTNAPLDERYDRKTAVNGKYFFTLKARNGEIIGTSILYDTTSTRDARIEIVKKEAPDAPVQDLS